MSPKQAQRLLGLAPGADVPAIRKAYAALLKALDVDADPEGYANLRLARDVALRAAKTAQPANDPEPVVLEPVENAEVEGNSNQPWPYAAPYHDGLSVPPAGSGVVADLHRTDTAEPSSPATLGQAALDAPAVPPSINVAFAGPPLVQPRTAQPADVTTMPRPDRELARVLRGSGDDHSPLTDEEEALARRALDALLTDAARSNLTVQGEIEDWLADLLAETWPHSAPLLQTAADAFGWENERGQLRERRSIAWLNARLRGLRFQEKVLAKDHPLHKAWMELHRPGWSTWLDRRRVKRAEVKQLLDGVRTHFAELEDHFDPQRVASWETSGSGASLGTLPLRLLAVGLFVAIQYYNVAHRESSTGTAPPAGLYGPAPQTAHTDPDYNRIRDAAVAAAFGEGKTIQWLREHQASLSATFEANLRAQRLQASNDQDSIQRAVDQIRRIAYLAGRQASGPVLQQTMTLHLAQIDAASRKGPQACVDYLRTGSLFMVPVSDAVRGKEQALAASMVEAGTLTTPPPQPSAQVSVPGAIISQIIDETGLPERTVRQGMQDKGSAAERCAVERALLHTTLGWKGPERSAILRIL